MSEPFFLETPKNPKNIHFDHSVLVPLLVLLLACVDCFSVRRDSHLVLPLVRLLSVSCKYSFPVPVDSPGLTWFTLAILPFLVPELHSTAWLGISTSGPTPRWHSHLQLPRYTTWKGYFRAEASVTAAGRSAVRPRLVYQASGTPCSPCLRLHSPC